MYRNGIKRLIDYLLAFIALIILFPILLFVMIFLFVANQGSPFFLQKRPGKDEKIFTIIKFKTMNDKRDSEGKLLSDTDRITRIGKFVRATSLDEIPQLINVIKGDMSLIGPRPLLIQYLPLYNEFQKQRHLVRPGITGYAQVNGRNDISWERKFELDVWYVQNQSFLMDFKIILKTTKNVIFTEGIQKKGYVTTAPFKGN